MNPLPRWFLVCVAGALSLIGVSLVALAVHRFIPRDEWVHVAGVFVMEKRSGIVCQIVLDAPHKCRGPSFYMMKALRAIGSR